MQIPDNQLKEYLIQDGIITDSGFDQLLAEAKRLDQKIADLLISRGLVTEKYLASLLTRYFGVEQAVIDPESIDESIFKILPENIARERRVIIFSKNKDNSLNIAMENPSDLETVEFLNSFLKTPVHPFLATPNDLQMGLSIYSREFTKDFKKNIEENIRASLVNKGKGIAEAAADVPIVALVDNIVTYASSLNSSDIHIEPLEDNILVRYRIDGILHEIMRIPKDILPALIARVKLLSSLKLDEHSKSQDGRFRYKLSNNEFVDIRVSIMPTFHGEKSVLRLLPATQKPMSLEELGFESEEAKIVAENIKKTYGMVVICGPTGSGKTTTLYSLINILNRPEVNIVTIEDPIEYEIKYVNQTQINPRAGITFADGLRSMLRQDPNIILVGEIRDEETAEISVHAALTGHLLLSSLHTSDAPTAIPRLLDMNVEPFLVSAVLNVVIAQRLVRRICPSCIYSYEPDEEMKNALKRQIIALSSEAFNPKSIEIPKILYKGKGCPSCGQTGYRGRQGIFEVLHIDDAIRELIIESDFNLEKVRAAARSAGMKPMFLDGLHKAELGVTTIEEILRVIRE